MELASISSIFLFLLVFMSSCSAIGDIFKAGAWYGALLVIGGIALVIWLVAKLFGGGNR